MKLRLLDRAAVAPPQSSAFRVAVPAHAVSSAEQAAAERARAEEEARAQIGRELATAKEEAERLITEARSSATQLLDEARAAAAQLLLDASRRGEEDAKLAARAAADEERAKFAATWAALREHQERSTGAQIDRVARLAGAVAERIVGRALAVDPTTFASLARQAVAELRDVHPLRFEVHDEDAPRLREALDAGGFPATNGCAIAVIPSPSCERGSFRIHTDLGSVDATLSARIERLTSALRDALHNAN